MFVVGDSVLLGIGTHIPGTDRYISEDTIGIVQAIGQLYVRIAFSEKNAIHAFWFEIAALKHHATTLPDPEFYLDDMELAEIIMEELDGRA